jgi:hypothetical protein
VSKKLPEVKTVGQMRKLLAYYPDDQEILIVQYDARDVGDDTISSSFTVSETYYGLIITPVYDGCIEGTLLNPDEL